MSQSSRSPRSLRLPTGFASCFLALPVLACLQAACARPPAAPVQPAASSMTVDTLARDYVDLVLAIGEHDPSYVDAYYGPEEWRTSVKARPADLATLAARASKLSADLQQLPSKRDEAQVPPPSTSADADLAGLRLAYLQKQTASASARIAMLQGTKFSFDEESRKLYDAVAPPHDEAYFQDRLDRIDAELRGLRASVGLDSSATLRDRVEALRARVTIPADKIEAVFARAIAECRARTQAHIPLPAGETFTVEQVTGKPWSAYNWYQGNLKSVIQVNVELPIWIDRAVDLACHEGYPGHHVYNLLLEQKLVRERGWPEYQVYALFSPQSLIAEGSANFGIEMAFPGEERLAFERDVLFPLAGLDPALAAPYARVSKLVGELSYASNEAGRRYLDGEIDAAAAAAWLERFALSSADRAAQRVRFIDTYRSYVINYNLGQDLVRAYVDARAAGSAERRWEVFADLVSSPRLPASLAAP